MKFCANCGKEVNENAVVCVHCGCSISNKSIGGEDSSSILYLLLGLWQPMIGLILYLIWKDEKPLAAHNAGKGALIGVIASALIGVIFALLYIFIFAGIFGMALFPFYY